MTDFNISNPPLSSSAFFDTINVSSGKIAEDFLYFINSFQDQESLPANVNGKHTQEINANDKVSINDDESLQMPLSEMVCDAKVLVRASNVCGEILNGDIGAKDETNECRQVSKEQSTQNCGCYNHNFDGQIQVLCDQITTIISEFRQFKIDNTVTKNITSSESRIETKKTQVNCIIEESENDASSPPSSPNTSTKESDIAEEAANIQTLSPNRKEYDNSDDDSAVENAPVNITADELDLTKFAAHLSKSAVNPNRNVQMITKVPRSQRQKFNKYGKCEIFDCKFKIRKHSWELVNNTLFIDKQTVIFLIRQAYLEQNNVCNLAIKTCR